MNKQLALAIQLNQQATLENFCWDNNHLLHQQLNLTLQQKGERFIYLWGDNGSGKSHLLQACCQTYNEQHTSSYLPLTILQEWGPESLENMDEQNLIALDDINIIAGNNAWEEAIFHFYNRIKDNDKTILLVTGNQPPAFLDIQLADLRTRLSWGLVMQVNQLNDEMKIQALQKHAYQRGIKLPSEVAHFLINRCARNMHDLYHLLNQLDEASLIAQRKITVPFVKSILNI